MSLCLPSGLQMESVGEYTRHYGASEDSRSVLRVRPTPWDSRSESPSSLRLVFV
jgi:hypothetical protein